MKKYDKYKDSGIEWIGEIPEHWESISMKYCLRKKITDGPHETPKFISSGIPFLSVDSIKSGELFFKNCRKISKEEHERFKLKCIVEKNDILMGKAASIGKIARVKVDFEFSIWSPLALLKPILSRLQPSFLEYLLKSEYVQFNILQLSTFNTQRNISMQDIPKISLTLPNSIEEQTAIANFLDRKTAEIDELIANKEKLLKLYEEEKTAIINQAVTGKDKACLVSTDVKMKDSGVEWLGEIPEHWEVLRLKRIVTFSQGIQVDLNLQSYEKYENSIRFLRIENYTQNSNDFRFIDNDIDLNKIVNKNDIVVVRYGATAGFIGRGFEGVLANNLFIVSPINDSIIKNYLYYFLKNMHPFFQLEMSGSAMPALNFSMLENIYIPKITTREQTAIVHHIETETDRINSKITKTEKLLKLLKEYKTSLISEVVTGKIDVREENEPRKIQK